VIVRSHVALVVDLDQHIAVAVLQHPADGLIHTAQDRLLVLESLVLAEVKQAQDDHHAELVGAVENLLQPAHVFRPEVAFGREGGVVPGLLLGVAFGAAALEVHRKGQQPVAPPLGHGCDELSRVAIGVPPARVRVGPSRPGLGIQVVKDALHQAGIEQQAFDPVALPRSPLIRRPAVDVERIGTNGDLGPSARLRGAGCEAENRPRSNAYGSEDNEVHATTSLHWGSAAARIRRGRLRVR